MTEVFILPSISDDLVKQDVWYDLTLAIIEYLSKEYDIKIFNLNLNLFFHSIFLNNHIKINTYKGFYSNDRRRKTLFLKDFLKDYNGHNLRIYNRSILFNGLDKKKEVVFQENTNIIFKTTEFNENNNRIRTINYFDEFGRNQATLNMADKKIFFPLIGNVDLNLNKINDYNLNVDNAFIIKKRNWLSENLSNVNDGDILFITLNDEIMEIIDLKCLERLRAVLIVKNLENISLNNKFKKFIANFKGILVDKKEIFTKLSSITDTQVIYQRPVYLKNAPGQFLLNQNDYIGINIVESNIIDIERIIESLITLVSNDSKFILVFYGINESMIDEIKKILRRFEINNTLKNRIQFEILDSKLKTLQFFEKLKINISLSSNYSERFINLSSKIGSIQITDKPIFGMVENMNNFILGEEDDIYDLIIKISNDLSLLNKSVEYAVTLESIGLSTLEKIIEGNKWKIQ